MKKVMKDVKAFLPDYNQRLFSYRKSQMNDMLKELDNTWKSIVELIDRPDLVYEGYRIVPFEERRKIEHANKYNTVRNPIEIMESELSLIEFKFIEEGMVHIKHAYIPYEVDGGIILNGTIHHLQYVIFEKLFFKTTAGINFKVKLPIQVVGHDSVISFKSEEGIAIHDTVVFIKIHNKSTSVINKTTTLHYLMSHYGYPKMMEEFNICKDSVSITDRIEVDDDYLHFNVTNKKCDHPIYLRVRRSYIDTNYIGKRFVTNMIKMLTSTSYKFTIDDILDDERSKNLASMSIGYFVYSSKQNNQPLMALHATKHLESLPSYVGRESVQKLAEFGITDIWGLLKHIFEKYEYVANSIRNNDLFNKRIELTSTMTKFMYSEPMFKQLYKANTSTKKDKLSIKDIPISINSMSRLHQMTNKTSGGSGYNDNVLLDQLAVISGVNSIRQQVGAKKATKNESKISAINLYHKSYPVVQSINYVSSSNPGKNGILNPFVEIDEHGGIVRPDDDIISNTDI